MKIVLIGASTLFILIFFSYLFYSGDMPKSDVIKVEVQNYDQEGNKIGQVKVIEDQASLQNFTEIMDSAIHDKDRHSLLGSHHYDYKVTVFYKNTRIDHLIIWISENYADFYWENKEKWFEINKATERQELLSLFK